MPQRRRQPKESGLDRITLMVPADLKAKLEAEVKPGVQTFSDVARDCLRRGLEIDSVQGRLSPWARVIVRHLAYLAHGAENSPTADEALAQMKARAAAYFETLLEAFLEVVGPEEMKRIETDAEAYGRAAGKAFGMEVRRAHEAEKRAPHAFSQLLEPDRLARGVPSREQLVKDQKVLCVSPEALEKIRAFEQAKKGNR